MKAFFGGKWQGEGTMFDVVNPYSGGIIDQVPILGPEVLEGTLTTLRKGGRIMAQLTREEHHRIFMNFVGVLQREAAELARMISCEQGKVIGEAEQEVRQTIVSAEHLADSGTLIGSRILPLAREASLGDRYGYTVRHPHGVVAVITPNPQPLVLATVNAMYALAAGNAVVLKPSLHTPLVVLRMVELLLESGCPPEAIACLTGEGESLGRALSRHGGVDHLVCSGSIETMKSIRSQMKFVTSQLQWGCVATCVVGKSADIKLVADEIMRVAFEASGQAAFTPTWIACFEARHDDLRALLKERMEALVSGDPLDRNTGIGPLAEPKKLAKLEERIARETQLGAEIVTGGCVSGQLYRPMLLDGCVLAKTHFAKYEIAAPVIGLTPIRQAKDAIDLLRQQRHHVLTLFSNDDDWAARQATGMPFNNVHVNGIPTWRDGLICLPGHPMRTGRRFAGDRIADMSHLKDVVFH